MNENKDKAVIISCHISPVLLNFDPALEGLCRLACTWSLRWAMAKCERCLSSAF